MKARILGVLAALFLAQGAMANTTEGEEISALDTTTSWGFGHDDHDRYAYYKCYACKKRDHHRDNDRRGGGHGGGHGGGGRDCYYGDGNDMREAKWEALRECYDSTRGHCFIQSCRKYQRR